MVKEKNMYSQNLREVAEISAMLSTLPESYKYMVYGLIMGVQAAAGRENGENKHQGRQTHQPATVRA